MTKLLLKRIYLQYIIYRVHEHRLRIRKPSTEDSANILMMHNTHFAKLKSILYRRRTLQRVEHKVMKMQISKFALTDNRNHTVGVSNYRQVEGSLFAEARTKAEAYPV